MHTSQNTQLIYQDDEIDLLELGKKIWGYRKTILIVTLTFVAFAILYILISTPMYKATALVETGHYKNEKNEEILVATTADSVQKLTVAYIELLKEVEGLDYEVERISEVKNNKKFFNIDVIATSNDVATAQIKKMVDEIANEHQNILNAYLENKKVQLANIERQINFLKNNKVVEKQEQIEYVKNIQLPRIDRQISYMKENAIPAAKRDLTAIETITLSNVEKLLELNNKKLAKHEAELEKLHTDKNGSAEDITRMQIMEQAIYSKISSTEQNILGLEKQKEIIVTQIKPNAQDRLDKLINIDLENLNSEKDTIMNDKLPMLQRELSILQTEELNRLLDQKSLVELSLKPYNYQNTAIVSDIAISEQPVEPRKAIILAIAMLAGFMMSVFGVLVYDAINKSRAEFNGD